MKTLIDILKLMAAIGISQLAGGIDAIATAQNVRDWYSTLNKPSFNPPSSVFAPVWTTLFTLMGIAAWLVWRKGLDNRTVRVALILFLVQLVLNTLWSFLFFEWHLTLAAFVELLVLWVAILLTIIWFYKVSLTATILMIPYIIWVSFAGVLNFAIWWLNR